MRNWICRTCGHEVLARGRPADICWTDGHICRFEPKEYKPDMEACPGCGLGPGDGYTPGCEHPDGCGYWKAFEELDRALLKEEEEARAKDAE